MTRIRDCKAKTTLKSAVLLTAFLMMAVVTGFGQQQINLSAAPTSTQLPDGTVVPMWGYFCGSPASGSTATCAALNSEPSTNPNPWSPVIITVPTGQGLTINLTNNLSFSSSGTKIPTSIVIVGQVGGGLGTAPVHNGTGGTPTSTDSPDHSLAQGCPTWFIASQPPGTPCSAAAMQAPGAVSGTPPQQGPRVQSMGAEVEAGTTTSLTWTGLKPGTYLLESGTHPSIQVPMGLIGMVVVTAAPSGTTAGTAYPGVVGASVTQSVPAVKYNAEVPLEFSEIDPVQNKAVSTAVNTAGFSEATVWDGHTGMCGDPNAPVGVANTCYPPAVNYTPFYYLINGAAFTKTNPGLSVFAATAGSSTPASSLPANGTVLVRLVNAGLRMHVPSIVGSLTTGYPGVGSGAASSQGSSKGAVQGFSLIAEDGNVLPGVATAGAAVAPVSPRVQTDVFMAAGKTYDVMVNVPTASASGATPALPIYDRELSLSGNSSVRDAGMLAYISVNNSNPAAALPNGGIGGIFAVAAANPDTYNSLVVGQPFTVSDPSKGVIANDVNVYGVTLLTAPANGTITCNLMGSVPGMCANGTFTYTPNSGSTATSDSFTYCANDGFVAGNPATCTTSSAAVNLGASTLTGSPSAINQSYTAKTATFIKIPSPGLLMGNTDPNNLPLTVVVSSISNLACTGACTGTPTVTVDPQGGFIMTVAEPTPQTSASTATFKYQVQNSQGVASTTGTVKVTFPIPSNLQVNVLDAQAYNNCKGSTSCISSLISSAAFGDYRWIIEEDKTFWVDPNCTTNSSATTAGCPSVVPGPSGQTTIPSFGVNFHTSTMDFVAQGCTGPLSCEGGQMMLDTRPACTGNNTPAGCSTTSGQHIPAVCDLGNGACRPDPTNGQGSTPVFPSQVVLDPGKRYYISVLPGDAANPFPANVGGLGSCPTTGVEASAGDPSCGHTMSGAPIPPACNILGGPNPCTSSSAFSPVNVLVLPTPLPTGQLSVLVFEDDFPLNGEQDGGGGGGAAVAPIEPGLGGFNLVLWDNYGNLGDATGQDTYDMFNMPLSNSLAGSIDPTTGLDACPISATPLQGPAGGGPAPATGMTGMIVTCPKYEADGHTLSPLAGQAVIANLMPDKFSVQAYPGADRIARGEQWIQTNTLDGQHPHDAFIPIGGPAYFQEYGPAGYHVMIGFANPAIINARQADVCAGLGSPGTVGPCTNTIKGQVNVERLSRIPDERLYPSESHDALAWTQCWVSLGDPDGEDFMFTFCDANGNFQFTKVPSGNWRLTIGDQWNDQIIDGLSTPANVGCSSYNSSGNTGCTGGQTLDLGKVGVQQWQSNLYTKTCIDANKNGICDSDEIGIPLIYTMIHYRDGHNANALTTDFNGVANFNETFPLFNWYVVEADSTRYKTTGIHTVYDAGGPADGTTDCGPSNGARPCGTSKAYSNMTNTYEAIPLPTDLSVPGAVYCASADCTDDAAQYFLKGLANPSPGPGKPTSTGRIDPPWVWAEGFAGLTGHSNWMEIGKAPYAACNPAMPASPTNFCTTVSVPPPPGSPSGTKAATMQVGENGGIYGNVTYASTRPFDDASQMIQQPWEPNIPNVTVNLYQEGFAADGVTPTLTLVDTTVTSSWDAWAQGFYPSSSAGTGPGAGQKPYLSCPGQDVAANDLFYFTLYDQPNYLDWYNSEHDGGTLHTIPYNSQFKCYDAMKINNQLQPAPYDGRYYFPSITGIDSNTGKALGTNCTICVNNPDSTDQYRYSVPGANGLWSATNGGTPMLPPGKYVVEVIMPPGYEVYKEEDKNLLIGDNFIAPVTQQFGGLGADIFIIPDQASVASMYDESGAGYNPTNYQNSTTASGLTNEQSGVPGFPGYTDETWPCVGEMRVVPDYLSEFPQALETAPFAGATRPLCDRKEVTLTNQMAADARFFIFTSTHIAARYTGVITDDFTSEFDPFSPQFGEKFAPPNLPISTKDYLGNELSRVYSDHWGTYDGLTFSSWDVNPPNITGYSPAMMTQCMNDPGPIMVNGQPVQDPLYNSAYSNFCYVNPFMPGVTTYNDTPVVPTEGFVGAGYNNVDCAYPDATPAVAEVDGDGVGPWVAAPGGAILSVSVSNGGGGYTTAPTVTFTGGGTGATATAVVSGSVTGVNVTNHGNYSSTSGTPTISFTGGGGSGAAATASMSGDVFSTTRLNGGSGYTGTPTVTFAAPGCTINGTTCVQATGTAVRNAFTRTITSITINNHGVGYTTAPAITFTGGGGSGANFTATLGKTVASVNLSSGGTGYTGAPGVTFNGSTGTGGTTAAGTAAESGQVTAINVTNGGSGYSAGTVSFTGGGGTGAIATATLSTGGILTITALGNQQVNNSAYSGPSASAAPFDQKTISRHYGFGAQCTSPTASSPTCNTLSSVTIGGQPATITTWGDTSITVTVPGGVPACAVQQQAQYGGSNALCGQLTITAGNGKQSIDAVTVTIGGKAPTHVNASSTVQSAIDAASPGDLIIVDPTCTDKTGATACSTSALLGNSPTQTASQVAHNEMLLMWKPVRLQGVGAASSIIDSNAFPAGRLLNPWRRHVNCLFGLTLSGVPIGSPVPTPTTSNPNATSPAVYDSTGAGYSCPDTGWNYFTTATTAPAWPQVDRIPLESVLGWDATLNGNLAEQLQEPSLMGAYEGAGVTVLAKGVLVPTGQNPFGTESVFPAGSLLLQDVPAGVDSNGAPIAQQFDYCTKPGTKSELSPNPYPSNFECNPSSIDGLTIRDSSQGGGGVFIHGWAHNLQIANDRIYNNAGTLGGGISVGQGEFPDAVTVTGLLNGVGEQSALDTLPSCQDTTKAPGNVVGIELPFCLDVNVNMHNNAITSNSSLGDELFSGTLAGGGGAVFCTGSDYYKFDYNWVCGNISTAEGGGITHLGFIYNGDIQHNTIALNQSVNPTIPTNGGGIMVMGTPDTDPTCTNIPDADCPPGLSDGTGPSLVINANLVQANSADSGSGGGIRLQSVNGTEVSAFPSTPKNWNSVSLTNNIVVNNVAGWDGAGISLQDALNVSIINNTIASNDTLATSGVLTQSVGTPVTSAPAGNCVQPGPTGPTSASCPQSAGVTSMQNTTLLSTTFVGPASHLTCPNGTNGCMAFSNPLLQNNLIWQNRAFYIGITGAGSGLINQQNQVGLFNAISGTPAPTSSSWGSCTPANGNAPSYWDIGVRGDKGPGSHDSGFQLNPQWSILDDPGYSGSNNFGDNPNFGAQYCNGSRVPPTCTVADGCAGPSGYGVPPGIVDASAPNPVFTLTPSATVDEGNNWINVSWGPLALSNDSVAGGANGNYGGGSALGNYAPVVNSPAIDYIPTSESNFNLVPNKDFYGNPRPDPAVPNRFDVGAIEYQNADTQAVLIVTPSPAPFGNVVDGTTATQVLTLRNDGANATGIAIGNLSAPYSRTTNCGTTLNSGSTCTITVTFAPVTPAPYNASLTITATGVTVNGAPVAISGTGVAPIRTATVTPTTLNFGNQTVTTTSPAQTVTVTNTGNVALTGGGFTVAAPFLRATALQGGAGTCGATLAVGANCTINVVFAPPTSTNYSRTLTVGYTDAPAGPAATVTGSPVTLTGTGLPRGTGTLAFTSATNGTLGTVLGARTLTFTIPAGRASVTSVVTITNTGAGSLQITGDSLTSNFSGLFSITGTTCSFTTPLAHNGTCTVSIQYATPATAPFIPNLGTANVQSNGTATSSNLGLIAD